MIEVPKDFLAWGSRDAVRWAAGLPALAEKYRQRWDLRPKANR
jgi:hypothetical protein